MLRFPTKIQNLLLVGLGFPIVALNIWVLSQFFRYFEHLITILTIAALVAFLLNYPVKILEQVNVRRLLAIVCVLLITLTLLIILGVTVVPNAIEQTTELIKQVPEWIRASNENINAWEEWGKRKGLQLDFNVLRSQINAKIDTQLQIIGAEVVGLAVGTLSGVVDTLSIIVLSIYMLLYGDRLWFGIVAILPEGIRIPLSESLRQNFQNFFISQLILGTFMATSLTAVFFFLQVPFGLSFAIFIGAAELIPFIGASLGIGLVTVVIMLKNFGLGVSVLIASVIVQQIKDNLLAPKLMGEFIGLNPIAILICLLTGGQIAGLLGVIVSVPIAGTIKGTFDLMSKPPHNLVPQPEYAGESLDSE
ncbi:AI-2E family transporter [Chamaesiphon minutus]|uniref:Putative permease n=1 Tax=Chamaesiphon minutus (strain ATCC 27169 / PCC 6605) TaxID=1173020 RepID=K9UM92_CHAP6|nr:AI-2E family transporter [Chamaesiphon minutus]AFY95571.1 putative permease [Chamaesiphon minutus PCC 6605]